MGGTDLLCRLGGNAAPRAGLESPRSDRRDALLLASQFPPRFQILSAGVATSFGTFRTRGHSPVYLLRAAATREARCRVLPRTGPERSQLFHRRRALRLDPRWHRALPRERTLHRQSE